MKARCIIGWCPLVLPFSVVQAATLKTTVTVLGSLDTQQAYLWFTPGYASTECEAQTTGRATNSYGSVTASANGSSSCQTYSQPAASGTTTYTGHVLYFQMPDARVIVAACDKRVNWTEWSGRRYRDCRAPQCTTCNAEITGEKVKITWPVSLDGSKNTSEIYRIQAVLRAQRVSFTQDRRTTELSALCSIS